MKIDTNEAYKQKYKEIYNELEAHAIGLLNSPTGKKLSFKLINLRAEVSEKLKLFSMVRISKDTLDLDSYTHELFNEYEIKMHEYEVPRIEYFLDEHLENLQKKFANEKSCIPQNRTLSKGQTAELIGKHEATKLFKEHLYDIEDSDDLDIVFKKISLEGYKVIYEPIQIDLNDTTQESKLKLKFTSARQILAIKYLLNFVEESHSYDNTKLAEFIQFLTGKELGAKKISNTNIYKKINKIFNNTYPEKVEDLEYIKKYFDNLNLKEIAEEIEIEINSSSKISGS